MKRNRISPARLLPLFALVLSLTACTKEVILDDQGSAASTPHGPQAATSNHPTFKNGVQGSACVEGYTTSSFTLTSSTRNNLTWTVGSLGAANYNFYGVPVTYGLYKWVGITSGMEQFQRMHTFSTMVTSMAYHGSLANMPNGVKEIIFVDESGPTYPATLFRVNGTWGPWYTCPSTSCPVFADYNDDWEFIGNLAGAACPVISK